MSQGTTMGAGAKAIATSKGSRPATGGNKNVQSSARRMSASDQGSAIRPVIKQNLKGPS